jgi:hypothetical protein
MAARVAITAPNSDALAVIPNADGSLNVNTSGGTTAAGAIATAQVSVANLATLIAAARTGPPGTGRVAITIENSGTTDVFIGLSNVTTGTGILLPGVKGAALTIPTTAAVYGITASASQTVTVLESY